MQVALPEHREDPRVATLIQENARLKAELQQMRADFESFRKSYSSQGERQQMPPPGEAQARSGKRRASPPQGEWDSMETESDTKLEIAMKYSIRRHLNATKVPLSNQTSWEKAAGLYQACMSFAVSSRNETTDLAAWMISLNLDFTNETRLATVNPVEMIVRCSLDLGVPALFSIVLHENFFFSKKRAIKIEYSTAEKKWLEKNLLIPESEITLDYALLLRWYGVNRPADYQLALKIYGYEKELIDIEKTKIARDDKPQLMDIRRLGVYTTPHVNAEQWGEFFAKYTNNTYQGVDSVFLQTHVINMLEMLLEDKSVGEKGLRHLVAWSVYTQLVDYTKPWSLVGHKKASDACYEHVGRAMKLALVSPYLQSSAFTTLLTALRLREL
ncbi:uncharacterized protein LOC125944351 [Dermacentor silvarum]|uniref:uncharacterized protein LOC125944351 n=1 Tax=Dermacentor silvarum TaxID=543639 RepID=UPI002101C6E1|nr:uncharacterized protein LOC125944351 [Dermacentor silvarum]